MDLKQLAEDKNIRDPRKLYQYVRSLGVGPKEVSIKQAAAALRDSTQRELLAPQVRYQGHFAANAPGDQIQADLIDWGAANTKAKKGGGQYALVTTDVYTRKTEAVPIANKKASTVEAATADVLSKLGHKDNAVISTDKGQEWQGISKTYHPDNGLELIHQTKDVADKNGIAVVDASIKNIKRDLAAEVGKEKGRTWGDHLRKVVDDLNEKPNAAVFGPPDRVEENPLQEFKVLQRNAENFETDGKNASRMMAAVKDAGGFRAPTGNTRSFQPSFGPVQKLEHVDSQYVHSRGHLRAMEAGQGGQAHEFLLKQVRPARAEGKFESTLTTNPVNRKIGTKATSLLQNQALQLENLIHREGGVPVDQLGKRITGLKKLVDRYKNLTESNWVLQTFKNRFVVEGGVVRLRPRKVRAPPPEKDYGQKAGVASMDFFAQQAAKRKAAAAERAAAAAAEVARLRAQFINPA